MPRKPGHQVHRIPRGASLRGVRLKNRTNDNSAEAGQGSSVRGRTSRSAMERRTPAASQTLRVSVGAERASASPPMLLVCNQRQHDREYEPAARRWLARYALQRERTLASFSLRLAEPRRSRARCSRSCASQLSLLEPEAQRLLRSGHDHRLRSSASLHVRWPGRRKSGGR